ncbi:MULTISPECIES: restriction endonuclease subunit S [unclassified Ruegeria]|uniref:restriction endonuclease subunit S n=1 Tax=unclassified Ruegeria TaxID=2625375 RepID=UPI001ADD54A8|nr:MULTISPECIES: restriction endonuclease subunit S [unclassified Ruegeria]MBO9413774.1 restriction endonuclease subunit S [Ruegeria sp. R8_1]MBO9417756.1 restriction endonuclease subunit S [Ruegeria sp. R8_2]
MLDQEPRYESYKDSGEIWLGKVPTDWSLENIRAVTELKSKRGEPDLRVLSVYRDYGVIPKDSRDDNHNATSLDTSNYKVVEPGDLVVNKMKAWQGSMGVSEHRGIVSPAYITCKTDADKVVPRFLHYLLRSQPFIAVYNSLSYGVRIGQWDMHYEDFKKIPLAYPDLDTQNRIVSFLDEKTAEIDAAIAKKRRLIDLLNEQKVILINRAVTKGLNPDAPMKDSGVDWIGEIPAHWEIKQLRYISSKVGSGVTPTGGSAVYPDEGIFFLRSQNVHFDGLRLKDVKFISEKTNREMSNSQVCKNDVLLNITGASIGRSCVYDLDDAANVNQHVCIIRPKKGISSQFLSSLFEARVGSEQVWLAQNGASREGLNFADLRGFVLPIPPAEEQLQIQNFLSATQAEYRAAFDAVEAEISTLNEFKQTVIANAVTGKIKI